MKGWYKVSMIGWVVALLHLALSLYLIIKIEATKFATNELALFYDAFYIHGALLVILLYAKLKKQNIFEKKE